MQIDLKNVHIVLEHASKWHDEMSKYWAERIEKANNKNWREMAMRRQMFHQLMRDTLGNLAPLMRIRGEINHESQTLATTALTLAGASGDGTGDGAKADTGSEGSSLT